MNALVMSVSSAEGQANPPGATRRAADNAMRTAQFPSEWPARLLVRHCRFGRPAMNPSRATWRDGSIDCLVRVVQDINARKRAEELLRRQADLLDQSHDAIFTWKIGGGITYWNRGAELLYGYARDEAIGRVSHDLLRTRAKIPMQEVEAQIAEIPPVRKNYLPEQLNSLAASLSLSLPCDTGNLLQVIAAVP
jgi:PAS domain-containing protein